MSLITKKLSKTMEKVRLDGMRAGAKGILGYVLDMCKTDKTTEEIKQFCERSLNLEGMNGKEGNEQ